MSTADEQIAECLATGTSFVLDAGAGSGKTYSLVLALQALVAAKGAELRQAGQQIACITFTKVARDQIASRANGGPVVRVSTIHDFLWAVLAPHQGALKSALLKFNAQLDAKSSRKKEQAALELALASKPVTYSDRGSNFLEGRLFHDDLLSIGRIAFADNALLAKLMAAQFPVIFVDEYQDTSKAVIDILLDSLLAKHPGRAVVGLFGDQLQNIYHGGEHPGVGEIPAPLAANLKRIPKGENRRCSIAVIDLLNRVRTDIQQFPAANNLAGDAVYLHVTGPADGADPLTIARAFTSEKRQWTAPASERELYLTHRLIARKVGHETLRQTYQSRGAFHLDALQSGEDPTISFFLARVEPIADAWAARDVGATLSILRSGGYSLVANDAKRTTREALDKLQELRGTKSVGAVLDHVRATALLPLPDRLNERLTTDLAADPPPSEDVEARDREIKDRAFFQALFDLPYSEVSAFRSFFDEHTPFATKHGVKGDEFDTVYVVLDDRGANWNIYSFDKYLSGEDETGNAARYRRSRNVFYVCASRAKANLAVVDLGTRSAAKDAGIAALFGADRCFYI